MPIVAAAVIGAGASIYSSSQASAANNKSLRAQQQAQAEQMQWEREQLDRATQLNAPYTDAGYDALDQLMFELGLTQRGGEPDWNAYMAANPDVAQRAQEGVTEGLIGPGKQWATPQDWAKYHYENGGKAEGRQVTTTPVQAPQGRPDPETPTYFGPIGAPGEAPSFSPGEYKTSVAYAAKQKEATRAVNTGYAAKGLLRSGAAISGLATKTDDLLDEDYGMWWDQQLKAYDANLRRWMANATQYNKNRDVTLGQFNTDRSYDAGAYDTRFGNLLDVTRIGQSAANNTAAAGESFTQGASAASQRRADATSQAAANQAGINANLFGDLAGTAVNLLGQSSGTSRRAPKPISPVGFDSDGSPWRLQTPPFIPNNLLTPPNVRF